MLHFLPASTHHCIAILFVNHFYTPLPNSLDDLGTLNTKPIHPGLPAPLNYFRHGLYVLFDSRVKGCAVQEKHRYSNDSVK